MLDAPRILLGLSMAMLLLIVAAAFSYESAWSSADFHPSIATMEVGGKRAVEDANHWLLGLAFGVFTISALVASLFLATSRSQYSKQSRLAIASGGMAYVAVFVVMMFRYRDYAVEGPSLLGPFSTPTSWMVFGLWGVPAIFVVIYCLNFDTWFASEGEIQNGSELE